MDGIYKAVMWLDDLTRRQILLAVLVILVATALLGGGYYLGTQDAVSTQGDTQAIDDPKEAEDTSEGVATDLQNVSKELQALESLF